MISSRPAQIPVGRPCYWSDAACSRKKQQQEPNVIAHGGPEIRRQIWDRLLIEDGLLKRKYDNTKGSNYWTQMIVPHVLQEEIMKEPHAGSLEGHLREDKILGKIKERFYWPGMQQDIVQWICTCSACATHKSPSQHSRAPLQTVTSGFPMHVIAVDILSPLPQSTAGIPTSWWLVITSLSEWKHMLSQTKRLSQ